MASVIVSIDDGAFKIRAKNLEKALLGNGVPMATLDAGRELLRLSQEQVPLDEGTLQNTGTVEVDGKDVIIGYHTPYAARLHEHPEYRFQKGRKGKYLEDPLRDNLDALNLKMGKTIQRIAL